MNNINYPPFIKKGEGKPLIFLHGFMCNKQFFSSQINFFSNYFKVIAYDLYGFGDNVPAKTAYSLDDYADEFCKVVKEYNCKVNVVAHSFGCRVLLKTMARGGANLIDKAVFCGPAGITPPFSVKKSAKRICYKLLKPIANKQWLENKFCSSDYKMLDPIMKESFKKVTSERFDDYLRLIDNKVFLIYGEKDSETPLKNSVKFQRGLKNCSLYVMKGCTHFCFAERPNEFNQVVKEFLL